MQLPIDKNATEIYQKSSPGCIGFTLMLQRIGGGETAVYESSFGLLRLPLSKCSDGNLYIRTRQREHLLPADQI